jgi:excisionase family DNA binding protein
LRPEKLLTVEEAAQLTTMSPSWMRQRIFRKEISYLKIGRSVRIPTSSIEKLLSKSYVGARSEKRKDGLHDE